MDKFFTQENCDRCGESLKDGRIMSMYNTQCICMECKKKEILRGDYKDASDAEEEEFKKGNYNYKGIEN
jgi:hypothetical protein